MVIMGGYLCWTVQAASPAIGTSTIPCPPDAIQIVGSFIGLFLALVMLVSRRVFGYRNRLAYQRPRHPGLSRLAPRRARARARARPPPGRSTTAPPNRRPASA